MRAYFVLKVNYFREVNTRWFPEDFKGDWNSRKKMSVIVFGQTELVGLEIFT